MVDSGTTLADTFNAIESQLQTIQGQAPQQYTALTAANGPVQQDANQIASLNTQISQAQGTGQTPNALLDQRDQLLDDLSQYGSVSVTDPGQRPVHGQLRRRHDHPAGQRHDGQCRLQPDLTTASGGTLGALQR